MESPLPALPAGQRGYSLMGLFRLAPGLFAITLPRQSLLHALLFPGFQVEGVLLDLFNDVFLLHLPLETPQGVFQGFTVLKANFRQIYSPPILFMPESWPNHPEGNLPHGAYTHILTRSQASPLRKVDGTGFPFSKNTGGAPWHRPPGLRSAWAHPSADAGQEAYATESGKRFVTALGAQALPSPIEVAAADAPFPRQLLECLFLVHLRLRQQFAHADGQVTLRGFG